MITAEIKKLLENNVVALSTVNKAGKPHSIAVAYVKVKDGKVVISNNYITETIKNLKSNNSIVLAVWNKEWEKACVGFEISGQAEHYTSGEWHDFIKNLKENKDYPCKGAIVITVNKIKKLA